MQYTSTRLFSLLTLSVRVRVRCERTRTIMPKAKLMGVCGPPMLRADSAMPLRAVPCRFKAAVRKAVRTQELEALVKLWRRGGHGVVVERVLEQRRAAGHRLWSG